MMEHRTPFVKQQVNTKLDARFDDPAQGSVIVICGIVNEEGVVKAVCVYLGKRNGRSWGPVSLLKYGPDVPETQCITLM